MLVCIVHGEAQPEVSYCKREKGTRKFIKRGTFCDINLLPSKIEFSSKDDETKLDGRKTFFGDVFNLLIKQTLRRDGIWSRKCSEPSSQAANFVTCLRISRIVFCRDLLRTDKAIDLKSCHFKHLLLQIASNILNSSLMRMNKVNSCISREGSNVDSMLN